MSDGFKSLKGGTSNSGADGALVIVRPSELEKSGKTGVVAKGILESTKPNKFNPEKNDYFIRGSDNTLYILNETASLKDQLGQDGVIGLEVEVHYNGKVKTKKGKTYHDFEVFAKAN